MNLYAQAIDIPREVLKEYYKQLQSHDYKVSRTPRGAEVLIGITINGVRSEIMGVLTQGDSPEALIEVMKGEIEKIINGKN
jgi:hypothetical protein